MDEGRGQLFPDEAQTLSHTKTPLGTTVVFSGTIIPVTTAALSLLHWTYVVSNVDRNTIKRPVVDDLKLIEDAVTVGTSEVGADVEFGLEDGIADDVSDAVDDVVDTVEDVNVDVESDDELVGRLVV